jgi:hypothetical protein
MWQPRRPCWLLKTTGKGSQSLNIQCVRNVAVHIRHTTTAHTITTKSTYRSLGAQRLSERIVYKTMYKISSIHKFCEVKRNIQGDSFGTRPQKMRISQRLFIRFWTCIYDYIPCFIRSMSILEEMLEMFATTVQAELNATLMNSLWYIRIFLGLVPKESPCIR